MKTLKEKEIKPDNRNKDNGFYLSKDVKQFINQLNEFIDDKKIIKSSGEGTNVEIIRFFEFEWTEFKDKYLGI